MTSSIIAASETRNRRALFGWLPAASLPALLSSPLTAAEVTFDRLKNAESEPGNWLTNHKTYDAKRFSPLDQINQSNVKNLHVAFAVQLGGAEPGGDKPHAREQSTPLVEDGILVHDRRLERRLQDRRARRQEGPHRLEDGSGCRQVDGVAAVQPRGRALRQPGHLADHRRPGDRDRQGDRQGPVGQGLSGRRYRHLHRRAAHRQGHDHRPRIGRRYRRALLADGDRRQDRQGAVAHSIRSRRRASPATRPGRTTTTPGRPAVAPSGIPEPTTRRPT